MRRPWVAYQMLDSLGIDKDKISEKNTLSNVHSDGMHSYFASYCDVFVTDDKATMRKTKALYKLFEIDSNVVNIDGFNQLLPNLLMEFEDDQQWFFQKLIYDLNNAERSEPFIVGDLTSYRLVRNHRYLDFFDTILEVAGPSFRDIVIFKGDVHSLSEPSFSECAKIISCAIHVFGLDLDKRGQFDYRNNKEKPAECMERTWKVDGIAIELKQYVPINKYALVITLPDRYFT